MRIIMTYHYSLQTPGGGTVGLLQIAQHLYELGVQVILVPVRQSKVPSDLPVAVRHAKPSKLHSVLDSIGVFRVVRELIYKYDVSSVIGWWHEVAFLPDFLRHAGIPFGMIAAFPSYRNWFSRKKSLGYTIVDWWFRKRPLLLANMVFALSEFTKKELTCLLGLSDNRVKVAYWGVNPNFFTISRTQEQTIERLLFFGSLSPHKGIFDLLHALALLPADLNWQLRVAGWGGEKAVLALARTLSLDSKLRLLGTLDHRGLRQELEYAQMAVLPSHYESFGLAIAEAQAAGLPVISCKTSAIPEVVENGRTGLLVLPGDIPALSNAILSLIRAPQRAYEMGLAGRERVQKLFSWKRTAQIILDTIASEHQNRCVV